MRRKPRNERELLVYCLRQHAPNLLDKLPLLDSRTVDADLVKEIMEAVGDELTAKVFLKDDKKSYEYGLELEAVIDKLVDYYWPDLKVVNRRSTGLIAPNAF